MKFILIDFQHIGSGGIGTVGLVTLLRNLGYESYLIGAIDIIDLLDDIDKLKDVLESEKPNAIGFSVMTPYADYIDKLGKLIKEILGDVPIIVGGYHATIFGRTLLKDSKYIDFVVMGDGEEILPQLLEKIKQNAKNINIQGVIAKNSNSAVQHSTIRYSNNLDLIPFPDEKVIHEMFYNSSIMTGHSSIPSPSRYVLYSRGCPYKCSFCKIQNDQGFRSKVRFYSSQRVLENLGNLIEKYSLKGIAFLDDNFILNKKWAYEICEGMIKNNFKIKWWAQIRANLADEELMKLMRKAGCSVATITIESGNDRIRREIFHKGITRQQIRFAYKTAKKLGMLTQGTLMMGSPTETYEECLDSVNFLREMDPDWAGVLLTTPLPGTLMYEMYKDRIRTTCYRDFDINLQRQHYSSNKVKLAFHEIPEDLLLKIYEQIKSEFEYNYRKKLRLRNFLSKERLIWMLSQYKFNNPSQLTINKVFPMIRAFFRKIMPFFG